MSYNFGTVVGDWSWTEVRQRSERRSGYEAEKSKQGYVEHSEQIEKN